MTPKSMWFQNTETNILALSPVVPNQLAFATDTKRWWITNLAASAWEPAALSPRGAWSSGATYKKSDIVTSAGSAWLALRTSTAVTPVEGLDWTLFVSKGDTGTTGASAAPFTDTTALVKGSADASKLVRVEADGLTTGTTRVITMPDQDVDLGTVEDSLLRVSRTEVSVTGATTLTSTAFGKMHRCSGGTYTVTLPSASGNVGKLIGLRASTGLTGIATVAGSGFKRPLRTGDVITLVSDGSIWLALTEYRANAIGAFLVKQNALQAIPASTDVLVNFDTIDSDAYGWFVPGRTAGQSRYIPQLAGWYQFGGMILYASATDQGQVRVYFSLNGVPHRPAAWIGASGPGNVAATGVAPFLLNGTTDYVEMWTYHSFGVTTDTFSPDFRFTYFYGYYLGA